MGPFLHRAAPYEEFFSWGSCHHCPTEVGAYRETEKAKFLASYRSWPQSSERFLMITALYKFTYLLTYLDGIAREKSSLTRHFYNERLKPLLTMACTSFSLSIKCRPMLACRWIGIKLGTKHSFMAVCITAVKCASDENYKELKMPENTAVAATERSVKMALYCVSKNDTDVAHYNFNANQPIMVIFGRDVAQRVCYQMLICYPTSPN